MKRSGRPRFMLPALLLWALFSLECERIDPRPLRLAFVTNNASDFWVPARRGCEQAAEELAGVEVAFRIAESGTAREQEQILQELLEAGVDGISITPVDPLGQLESINRAARRTLVVTHDSDAPRSDRVYYLGTDNVAAGRQAGELIRRALPEGGRVILFAGSREAQNSTDREAGIRQALEGSPVRILGVQSDDGDQRQARLNAQRALQEYPDLDALVGLWGYHGPALWSALREEGKEGQVRIICFDQEDETLQGIREGAIFGTVVQQPYEFGYQTIRAMTELLRGERNVQPGEEIIYIPTLLVTAENVGGLTVTVEELRRQP